MSQNGKGDSPRPIFVDRKVYESNWDAIFKKKNKSEQLESSESIERKTPHLS